MNKSEFTELACKTNANKCIHFEWSNDIKESCSKDKYCTCVLLKGFQCGLFDTGTGE